MSSRFWIETLGCPKNQVDSEKLAGTLQADGMEAASGPGDADLVVVNTCAFIDEARQESVDTILELDGHRREGARLVVTGCMAERYGAELSEALPEVSAVAPFGASLVADGLAPATTTSTASPTAGVPVTLGATRRRNGADSDEVVPAFDLLELPRPPATAPWAYVKVAEGCDRNCGFCAIPSFRGKQRSRSIESIVGEVDDLARGGRLQEVVLVAQDLAAYGRDQGQGSRQIIPLVEQVAERVARVRLLYLYPSDLTDQLIDTICATGVPYFDLSLQHVSPPLLRRMRRWGSAERFLDRITATRRRQPDAAFRSNFIVGYPGETEDDHDALLAFVEEAQLDWCGFFAYSEETGTLGATQEPKIPASLRAERLDELRTLQDAITTAKRDALIGSTATVLVDEPGSARSVREAPEIDGIVRVPHELTVGAFHQVEIVGAEGPDLEAEPVTATATATATAARAAAEGR